MNKLAKHSLKLRLMPIHVNLSKCPNLVSNLSLAQPPVFFFRFINIIGTKATRKCSGRHDAVKSEMDHFNQESMREFDDDSPEWWKSWQVQYPLMYQVMKKFWCLQPASDQRNCFLKQAVCLLSRGISYFPKMLSGFSTRQHVDLCA